MSTDHDVRSAAPRFAKKYSVHPETGCWEWTGATFRGGYGNFTLNLYGLKNMGAHRASLILAGVQLSADDVVDHLCRNPCCVNPEHLDVVDMRTNNIRGMGWSGMHYRRTHCANGHRFDEANTYVSQPTERRRSRRGCRKCAAAYQMRRRAAERGEVA